jgi:hypothetical protein
MSPIGTCRHPDRDCPKLLCGYPLPCPWHTVIVDESREPATVTIPVTSSAMRSPNRERVGEIARAIGPLLARDRKHKRRS